MIKKITVLIPCYNEEESLPLLYDRLNMLMGSNAEYKWQILFVNDGSRDNTIQVINQLRATDRRICFVDLSRNFGKEAAMLAGFDYSLKGEVADSHCVVIIDADLQHPPELIPEMLKYWEEGYDDVYAKRITRGKESWLRKRFSILYYKLLQKTTRVDVLQNVGDFRLLDRKCIEILHQLREQERYTKGLYCWIGFKKKEIQFEQSDRIVGKSSWNFSSLVKLAIDGITSYTTAPLRLSAILGIIISLPAFVYMCFILVKTLFFGDAVQGFPTLITVILFLGGVQLLSLGIIGEYLGRIFYETKNRPVYVVKEYKGESEIQSNAY